MGPLHLKVASPRKTLIEENWETFEAQLRQLKESGVTAISTDLWWGLVEGERHGKYDWSYYDRVVALLNRLGLQWVPILSFHRAGGNVNDDYDKTLPLWLWGSLLENNEQIESVKDLQYVSETGSASREYVSLWADDLVMPYYKKFMEAFKNHYKYDDALIDEINISMGPAGELRYPSYNSHDWGDYPNRGTLQCFSRLAKEDWLNHLENKYKDVVLLNETFGSSYVSFSEVIMPDPDWLFSEQRYIKNKLAVEFLTWYHLALMQHGKRVLDCALEVFDSGQLKMVPLGIKIPGIHWAISDPTMPRVAEVTAGLIAVHPDLNSTNQQEYSNLLKELLTVSTKFRTVVHFTCLEMINKDYEGYSRAQDLVDWMGEAAADYGVSLMGENALSYELHGDQGWGQMERALTKDKGYDGLTLLRMQDFFGWETLPLDRLKGLISRVS